MMSRKVLYKYILLLNSRFYSRAWLQCHHWDPCSESVLKEGPWVYAVTPFMSEDRPAWDQMRVVVSCTMVGHQRVISDRRLKNDHIKWS